MVILMLVATVLIVALNAIEGESGEKVAPVVPFDDVDGVIAELESEEFPSGGVIAKGMKALAGMVDVLKGAKAPPNTTDDDDFAKHYGDDEEAEDGEGDNEEDDDEAEDDPDEDGDEDEADEPGDDDDDDVAQIMKKYGLDDEGEGKPRGKPPVVKKSVQEYVAEGDLADVVDGEVFAKSLFAAFDQALDDRLSPLVSEVRRLRREVSTVKGSTGVAKSLGEPPQQVAPIATQSPAAALTIAQKSLTPPVPGAVAGGALGIDDLDNLTKRAVIGGQLSVGQAQGLMTAFGTPEWGVEQMETVATVRKALGE